MLQPRDVQIYPVACAGRQVPPRIQNDEVQNEADLHGEIATSKARLNVPAGNF